MPGGLRCRIEDDKKAVVKTRDCPLGHACTGDGRLEFYSDTTAYVAYFCDVPRMPRKVWGGGKVEVMDN